MGVDGDGPGAGDYLSANVALQYVLVEVLNEPTQNSPGPTTPKCGGPPEMRQPPTLREASLWEKEENRLHQLHTSSRRFWI